MPLSPSLDALLTQFKQENEMVTLGQLGTALVLSRKAKSKGLPIDVDKVLSPSGGQVSGLSGSAINKILTSHGVTNQVGTESGRTSRGTLETGKAYAVLLNTYNPSVEDIEQIERWWVEHFIDYFNNEPFQLKYEADKTFAVLVQSLLDQALLRQKRYPGKTYVGTVLQHLVGAKLELALPQIEITHNAAAAADKFTDRSGDFSIDDTVIHCTTAPGEPLLKKCNENIKAGKRPIIITIAKMIGSAENYAEALGIEGRVEVMDAVQFIAANLYEMSLFKVVERKVTLLKVIDRYNELIVKYESADPTLRIDY